MVFPRARDLGHAPARVFCVLLALPGLPLEFFRAFGAARALPLEFLRAFGAARDLPLELLRVFGAARALPLEFCLCLWGCQGSKTWREQSSDEPGKDRCLTPIIVFLGSLCCGINARAARVYGVR